MSGPDFSDLEKMFASERVSGEALLASLSEEKQVFAKFIIGEAANLVVRDFILPMLKKTKALEAEKFIEAETIEELANVMERVDALEKADVVGLAGAVIDRKGCLNITTTKGETINLGVVVGKDGADFSDAELDYDGQRGLIIRGKGGQIVKRMPLPMDGGFWREGMSCEKGDIVTNNGSAWLSLRDTKAKPCVENKEDWRLFARKGKDGK